MATILNEFTRKSFHIPESAICLQDLYSFFVIYSGVRIFQSWLIKTFTYNFNVCLYDVKMDRFDLLPLIFFRMGW